MAKQIDRAIRITTLGLPTLLRDIIEQVVAADPTLLLIDDNSGANGRRIVGAGADVVICGVRGEHDQSVTDIARGDPRLTVIALDDQGRGWLHRMQREPIALGEVSSATLGNTIRSVVAAS